MYQAQKERDESMFTRCIAHIIHGRTTVQLITALMIALVLVAGCGPSEPTVMPTPETSAQGFLLEGVGFKTPESVLYDPEADVYLVANINGDPSDKDGNGFISRISPEGKVLALKWIDGAAESATPFTLHAPKGMALSGDRLFVADIDVVRVFDRERGDWLDEVPVEGARFLNDVASGSDVATAEEGTVYVTDSGTGVIHRIMPDGSVEQVGQVPSPNGIQVHGETILVTGGSNQIFRLGDDGTLTPEYETPAGGLDGLILLNDGSVLVSSWTGSAIYRFDADGQVTELFSGINAPADIGFDTKRNVVLIPHFEDDRVEARPLSSTKTSQLSPTQTTASIPPTDTPEPPGIPPTIVPTAVPAEAEEIRFESEQFTLVGDLQIPGAEGKHLVIIMVHDDGLRTRR